MDIRQFMKSISGNRSVENNSDKIFQKWVLFKQHRHMKEPQTQLLMVQVHFRLICVEFTMITTFMHQFRKVVAGDRKYTFVAKPYSLQLHLKKISK